MFFEKMIISFAIM